jgi:hypothetical protein
MKKITLSIVCLLAVTFAAIPASAQTRARWSNRGATYNRRYDHNNRVYSNQVYRNDAYRGSVYSDRRYNNNVYYGNNGYYGRDRSVWDRSRDKITTAAGAGGGALIGSIIGGKKGAIIGALTGGGAAAIYTYGIRDKHHRRRF